VSVPPAAIPDGSGERHFPPVAQLATASLGLVVIGAVVMVSEMFDKPSLAAPAALVALSALCLAVGVVLLVRQPSFAWPTFTLVGRWALLAYLVSAGLIEFTFLHNHVGGATLLVLTLMLLIYVIDIPLIISFTVARYQTQA
jgi:hypothetical protein